MRLLGIRYKMWLDSTAQRRYVMDGITERACFFRKHRDLSIENSLRLVECTLAPLLAFSGLVIIWLEKEFKQLTAAFVRCNKEAWHMSPNTSTALFMFPRDQGGLQIKMPRAIICLAAWSHLTQCCQFDVGTRQRAEITYKDALKQHGCLDMEDLQFEAEFLTCDQASQNTFAFACHLTSTLGIKVSWDPFHPICHTYRCSTGDDNYSTPGPHTTKGRVEEGSNHGGGGKGETSNHAIRRRRNVHDEN